MGSLFGSSAALVVWKTLKTWREKNYTDCVLALVPNVDDETLRSIIADLLGHTIQSVTGTYARSTPDALEDAVNRLTEPRGNVIQFKRKAS